MKTIALANQKGGVGKTTTAASLGVGLAQQGKKVLLVDADAQGNLTQMLGWRQPDELSPTLADLMTKAINEEPIAPSEGILHHASGVDLVPANIELSGLEVTLVNIMSRETVLRQYLSALTPAYDYAIIDCMPSLGMLTINALTAADSVIIPVQGQYLAAKGLEQLIEKVITSKTKAIIINSPCNPTGVVMSEEDLREVAKVVEKYDIFVLSDEPYDALVYDGVKAFSLAQIPEIRNKVFVLNSFSKTYAMTGWRVGYVIVPDGYAVHFAHLNEGLISCIPGFIQHAATVALQSDECVKSMLADYTRRRDILVDGINAIPGFSCPKPRGSFYAFCNIKAFGKTSQEFAEELLTKAGVVVVPGSAFGACGEGYVRLVFANSDENLQEAVRRIASYVQSAYPNLH